MAKLIATVENFEIWKQKTVVIVMENDELFCNLRKADRGFNDPEAFVRRILDGRVQVAEEREAANEERKAKLEPYLADRRDRVAAQPMFAF